MSVAALHARKRIFPNYESVTIKKGEKMVINLMKIYTHKLSPFLGALLAVSLSLSIMTSQSRAGERTDFFEVAGLPIAYSYWGVIEDFHKRFSEVDDNEYLHNSSEFVPLESADLIIIVLADWADLWEIPIKYAGLIPLIQRIDPRGKESTHTFDISIEEGGEMRPVRAHFVALSNVSPKNRHSECLIEYVYATTLYEDINTRLESVGCGKES